jgi:hydrogenase/urease accessory protein HupE
VKRLIRQPRMRVITTLVLLLTASWATAHEVRPAYLEITETAPQRFDVVWKQPALADRRLAIDVVLPEGCGKDEAAVPQHTGAALIERWQSHCSMRAGVVHIEGLSATLTDTLVRVTYLDGRTLSRILRPSSASLDLSDPAPVIGAYFFLGVEHLLLGIDHILFVVGLVLFIRAPWPLVKAVTAFTVAHSITLALSVLQFVKLPQGPVEAVIALSILFLARELMLPNGRRSGLTESAPWLMAFAFGLLHGFGFAGALADIGLPREQLAMSLLLFNLGIEAGQLAVIAVLLSGVWLARQATGTSLLRVERSFSIAMGCAAGFWTIDRVMVLVS